MHVSLRGQYAVKAMVRLALSWGNGPVQARELAAFGGIPGKYLEQVMHDLRQADLVVGRRGKGGGYVLAREPARITFVDVLQAVEGSWGGLERMPLDDDAERLVRPVWREIRETVRHLLETTSIADVAANAQTNDMYYI